MSLAANASSAGHFTHTASTTAQTAEQPTTNPSRLAKSAIRAEQLADFETRCLSRGNVQPLTIHRTILAESLLYAGKIEEAASTLALAQGHSELVSVQGLMPSVHLTWLSAILGLWRPSAFGSTRAQALATARQKLQSMNRWAEGQPQLKHLALWVEAEVLLASGVRSEAIRSLVHADQLARQAAHIHHRNVIAARLAQQPASREDALASMETGSDQPTGSLTPVSGWATNPSPQGARALDFALDFEGLLNAARAAAVSRELSEAVSVILRNVAQLSGAQIAFLLSQKDGEWRAWDKHGTASPVDPELQLLPISVVQYVAKTRATVRVWARHSSPFSQDPYIERFRPAAMVCLPLQATNELHGLLYLEHRSLEDAFEEQRLKLAEFVASGGAIAISNANLFQTLQRDIERRKQVELELERNRLRALLEQSPYAIQVYSSGGELQSENPCAAEFYGRSPLGAVLACHPAVARAQPETAAALLRGDKTTVGDIHFDGSPGRWLQVKAYGVHAADGSIETLVVLSEDITARKRAEQVKSEFVSTVSHELRTPVASIQGALGLISGGVAGTVSPQVSTLISVAQRNSARLVALVNDILDTERLEAGGLRIAPSAVVVDDVLKSLADTLTGMALQRQVTLVTHSFEGSEQCLLWADQNRLLQVLGNFVSNALKFSPRGSVVRASASRSAGIVRFEVADQGPGIPDDFRAQLFERFARADNSTSRDEGGTGLGLFISKGLIERMGGTVGFAPNQPHGACFHLELPEYGHGSAHPS